MIPGGSQFLILEEQELDYTYFLGSNFLCFLPDCSTQHKSSLECPSVSLSVSQGVVMSSDISLSIERDRSVFLLVHRPTICASSKDKTALNQPVQGTTREVTKQRILIREWSQWRTGLRLYLVAPFTFLNAPNLKKSETSSEIPNPIFKI